MTSTRSNSALTRFAWLLAGLTLLLICSGGMVTSKNAGLAVPDWPTTFGYNMFFFPLSQWIGGVFFEHTHRLIASVIGFLTIVLAVWLWRAEPRKWVRVLGWAALGAVILQGLLGGLRVTLLKDEIGIFHACLAQAFLGLLVFIALATSRLWKELQPARHSAAFLWVPIVTTLLVYTQLALGATMRHQHRDLSILDFPMAYGQVIPDVSADKIVAINQWRDSRALSDVTPAQIWLQMAHRGVALLIFTGVISSWFALRTGPAALRRLSALWLFLVMVQIGLGAWTIWSNKAADIATTHVAVGASILGLGVSISAIAARLRVAETGSERAVRTTDWTETARA